jgi:hypothetical protein
MADMPIYNRSLGWGGRPNHHCSYGGRLMTSRPWALKLAVTLLFASVCISVSSRVDARTWNASPLSQATDYSTIIDNKGDGHTRFLLWLSSPLIPAGNKAARAVLDQYLVIGVVNAIMQPTGVAKFPPVGSMRAMGIDGKALLELQDSDLPPAMRGAMVTLRDTFSRSLGEFGRNMNWFTFEAGTVKACSPGRLSVVVEGDTYTYDTPIPGCSVETGMVPSVPGAGQENTASAATAKVAPADTSPAIPAPVTLADAVPPQATPNRSAPASGASVVTARPHFVASGGRVLLWKATALNPDCSTTGFVTFKTTQKPQHGEMHVATTKVFPDYPANNPRSKCNSHAVTGQVATYTARTGYTGSDFVEFETFYPGGAAFDVRIPIVVR